MEWYIVKLSQPVLFSKSQMPYFLKTSETWSPSATAFKEFSQIKGNFPCVWCHSLSPLLKTDFFRVCVWFVPAFSSWETLQSSGSWRWYFHLVTSRLLWLPFRLPPPKGLCVIRSPITLKSHCSPALPAGVSPPLIWVCSLFLDPDLKLKELSRLWLLNFELCLFWLRTLWTPTCSDLPLLFIFVHHIYIKLLTFTTFLFFSLLMLDERSVRTWKITFNRTLWHH